MDFTVGTVFKDEPPQSFEFPQAGDLQFAIEKIKA
jgi:hypothetical protein